MGRGINIEFVANVDKFIGRTKDIEGALDEVADSLDDLAKDGRTAGDKMGDGLTGGADDAEDAARRLERRFRDAYDEVKKGSRKAGDDLGDNVKRGADKAGDGLDDVKDEANDSAREVAASFDGSMDGVIGGVQELAANLGGLGPIGAAAGLAAAAGAGAMYEAWKKNSELAKQRVEDMYSDLLASGAEFLSESYIMGEVGKIVQGLDGAATSLGTVQEIVDATGLGTGTVLRAFSGDAAAYADVMGSLTALEAEQVAALDVQRYATGDLRAELERTAAAQGKATDAVTLAREAMRPGPEAARDYAAALGEVAGAVTDAEEAIKANGEAFTDATDRAQANDAVLADLADTLAGVNQAATDAGVSGADLAKVQADQVAAFLEAADAAGYSAGQARELARRYGLIPPDVSTDVSAPGATAAQQDVQDLKSAMDLLKPVDVRVNVITPAKAELAAKMRALALEVNVPVVVGVNRAGRAVV